MCCEENWVYRNMCSVIFLLSVTDTNVISTERHKQSFTYKNKTLKKRETLLLSFTEWIENNQIHQGCSRPRGVLPSTTQRITNNTDDYGGLCPTDSQSILFISQRGGTWSVWLAWNALDHWALLTKHRNDEVWSEPHGRSAAESIQVYTQPSEESG